MRKLLQRMMDSLERGRKFVTHDVWRIGLPGEEIPHGFVAKQVRVAILLLRGLTDETLLLRASALTFATMLFIVPFLAFMFYFIQTFDLGEQVYHSVWMKMESQLTQVIALVRGDEKPPLNSDTQDPEAAQAEPSPAEKEQNNLRLQKQILVSLFPVLSPDSGFGNAALAENPVKIVMDLARRGATNPQAISIAGLLFILSTVFGFMRNVESAFNRIWGVKRTRSPFRTVGDYLLITLLLPFVAAGVLGISAALESTFVRGALGPFAVGLRGAQFLMICLTFSLVYWGVPNTRVRVPYAVLGGIVAGILWIICSWGYVKFQFGLARYTLFFSTFALFPLLLMWIYASWLILLFGALLAFAYQNEITFAMERLADHAPFAYREALAVRTVVEMARRFQQGLPGLSVQEAAEAWNVPTRLLNETFDCLMKANLAVECTTEPISYHPARSPQNTRVIEVLRAVREEGRDPSLFRQDKAYLPLYEALERADRNYLESSVAELAVHLGAEAPPTEPQEAAGPDTAESFPAELEER